jgi:dTDP-4-amino-4,6-dideoxy-D-galactose acyltransferase
MRTRGAPCELLRWDSRFFGVKVASVHSDLDASQLVIADNWCLERGVTVAYLQVPFGQVSAVQAAEDLGFRFVDVRVTLAREIGQSRPPPSGASKTTVRLYRRSESSVLERIAATAHRDSRFYADHRFPRERCDALYAAWIRRSCTHPESTVLVAERAGDIAGYLAYRPVPTSETASIELVGVAEAHRGHGIGAALIHAGLDRCSSSGFRRVQVATQGRNVAAQRLYQRAGMTTHSVSVWQHKWYSDPFSATGS